MIPRPNRYRKIALFAISGLIATLGAIATRFGIRDWNEAVMYAGLLIFCASLNVGMGAMSVDRPHFNSTDILARFAAVSVCLLVSIMLFRNIVPTKTFKTRTLEIYDTDDNLIGHFGKNPVDGAVELTLSTGSGYPDMVLRVLPEAREIWLTDPDGQQGSVSVASDGDGARVGVVAPGKIGTVVFGASRLGSKLSLSRESAGAASLVTVGDSVQLTILDRHAPSTDSSRSSLGNRGRPPIL